MPSVRWLSNTSPVVPSPFWLMRAAGKGTTPAGWPDTARSAALTSPAQRWRRAPRRPDGEEHLLGLKRTLYDTPVLNAPRADLPRTMCLLEKRRVQKTVRIEGKDDIEALFAMTPYYYRTSEADRAKLAALDVLETEIDIELSVYRRPDRKE